MYFGEIKENDIANGVGVRTTLFVSGCRNHCAECFQPQTWSFSYGQEFTDDVADRIIQSLSFPWVNGLTVLGGEPFEVENQRGLLPLLRRVREELPGKTIWAYSGFTWEQLTGVRESRCRCEVTDEVLGLLDVLVDGPYVAGLRDITLRFRGSSNQRIIDVPRSLASGDVVLWGEDPQLVRGSWDA
ncbi:MAG: anaerobic ribonucleoside-triphosphate reductase activating protein [Coriobacteriia bacterium]|nr:anaerobic ribonucleoside-triphosphate reductase activating protein [Coriobacteriia bacterium]